MCVPWPSSSTLGGSTQDSPGRSHGAVDDRVVDVKLRLSARVEVRRDVRVGAVDAGVDVADEHVVAALLTA